MKITKEITKKKPGDSPLPPPQKIIQIIQIKLNKCRKGRLLSSWRLTSSYSHRLNADVRFWFVFLVIHLLARRGLLSLGVNFCRFMLHCHRLIVFNLGNNRHPVNLRQRRRKNHPNFQKKEHKHHNVSRRDDNDVVRLNSVPRYEE